MTIGIVLLACGIAALAIGSGVAERLVLACGLWAAAAAVLTAARRG